MGPADRDKQQVNECHVIILPIRLCRALSPNEVASQREYIHPTNVDPATFFRECKCNMKVLVPFNFFPYSASMSVN